MTTETLKGKENLNEQEKLRNDTTRGLSNLRQDVVKTSKEKTKEKKEEEKIQACMNHLRLVVDEKYYKNVMEKNTEATIKSVQYLLNYLGYDCGKVDGILEVKGKKTSKTMEAIKKFQRDNKWIGYDRLKEDGIPGKETIKGIISIYEGKALYLHLNGLTSLSNKQLEILSNTRELSLNGLTGLTDKQAESLSKVKALSLDGLTNLSDKQAESLSKVRSLYLNGLTGLTDKQAESLSKVKYLYLNGLTGLTDKQAESLSKVEWLELEGLTSITDRQLALLSKAKGVIIGLKALTDKQLEYLVKNGKIGRESNMGFSIKNLTYKEAESLVRKVGNLLVKEKIMTQKEMEKAIEEEMKRFKKVYKK